MPFPGQLTGCSLTFLREMEEKALYFLCWIAHERVDFVKQ